MPDATLPPPAATPPVGEPWTPDAWKSRPAAQHPTYPDAAALNAAVARLADLPPLVTSWEILRLRDEFARAGRGEVFVLQGGDCAESFAANGSDSITRRLKVLLQMSLVLGHATERRVVRVGRFAGQYAKPRSSDTETRDGVTLPSYRGDVVNAPAFTPEARTPDPARMVEAHGHSAMTLNFVRGLIDGGFTDLHHPEYWDLGFAENAPGAADYEARIKSIRAALAFVERLAGHTLPEVEQASFYTSHEALLLWYEQALTRRVPRHPGWFNLSTHFPWVGLRTADPNGAHIEYCRGIENPVGVKVGPATDPQAVVEVCRRLNPAGAPGRVVLIHRMGKDKLNDRLPALLDTVRDAGLPVTWLCDPMHGNTFTAANGLKTRAFDDIAGEIADAFALHRAAGTVLGGVHLELTGDNVTECVGGAGNLTETDLERAYLSSVDPRLNREQALELALVIARGVQGRGG